MRVIPSVSGAALALIALTAALRAAEPDPHPVTQIDELRANLGQALEYRDQAARERAAWEMRRGEVEDLVKVATSRIEFLEAAVARARPLLKSLRAEAGALDAAEREAEADTAVVRELASVLARRLASEAAGWPPPLVAAMRGHLRTVETTLALAPGEWTLEQLDKVVEASAGALLGALKYASGVNRTSEVRTLPDGRTAVFDVVFIGMAQGYFVSRELRLAGQIVWRDGRWAWIDEASLLEPLDAFLGVLDRERPATWIQLPLAAEAPPST